MNNIVVGKEEVRKWRRRKPARKRGQTHFRLNSNLMTKKKFPIFGAVIHHFLYFYERRSYSRYVN
jgi:hypothetical protein